MEGVDQVLAVFSRAGEHEVADVGGDEAVADDFQHADELAENEDLVAFFGEFFDPLQEGFEFGAGEVGVDRVD